MDFQLQQIVRVSILHKRLPDPKEYRMAHSCSGKSIEPSLLASLLVAFGFGWWQPDFANWAKGTGWGMAIICIVYLVFLAIVGVLLSRGARQLMKFPDKIIGAFLFSGSLYLIIINVVMMMGYMAR